MGPEFVESLEDSRPSGRNFPVENASLPVLSPSYSPFCRHYKDIFRSAGTKQKRPRQMASERSRAGRFFPEIQETILNVYLRYFLLLS